MGLTLREDRAAVKRYHLKPIRIDLGLYPVAGVG
jgi:hypothetical protein